MSIWTIDLGEITKKVSILGLMLYWTREVDRTEYPDFDDWKADMQRAGLIREER